MVVVAVEVQELRQWLVLSWVPVDQVVLVYNASCRVLQPFHQMGQLMEPIIGVVVVVVVVVVVGTSLMAIMAVLVEVEVEVAYQVVALAAVLPLIPEPLEHLGRPVEPVGQTPGAVVVLHPEPG
jgi:hypothetical protein